MSAEFSPQSQADLQYPICPSGTTPISWGDCPIPYNWILVDDVEAAQLSSPNVLFRTDRAKI